MEQSAVMLESPLPEGDGSECAGPGEAEVEAVEQVSDIRISVSPEGIEAFLSLEATPEEPYPFTSDSILAALSDQGIIEGILLDEIQRIADQQEYITDLLIAKGRDREEGENARIELLFDPSPKPYSGISDERIDWHEVGLIQTVAENQPVARKIPAVNGKPGITVKGKTIEPGRVRDARLPAGKATRIGEDDPNLLLAEFAGAVRLAGDKVVVDKVLAIAGDVDFSSGNINIDGGVQIGGNVLSGFRVRATGDIQVKGYVEGATVEAGGSVLVAQGILGHSSKTEVQAAKDVHAKFATNASIRAGADINVQWEALNCRLESGGTITVGGSSGKRGRIVGGQALAATAIRAVDIGAESGTTTTIVVSHKAMADYEQQEREATEQAASLRSNHTKIMDKVAKLLEAKLSGELQWNESYAQLFTRMTQAAKQIEEEILEIEERLSKARSQLNTLGEPTVVVRGTLYPGVRMTLGRATRSFSEKVQRVKAIPTDDRTSIITLST